jgi:hypothetical protein
VTDVTSADNGQQDPELGLESNDRSNYGGSMLGTTDLTNPIDVESLRRSVAMLPASADARIFSREEALRILDVLRELLRATEFD